MGIVILTPQSMTDIEETAAVVPEAIKGIDKPVVCSFMGAKDVAPGVQILRTAGIPNYPFPEDGVKSLAAANWLVTLHEIPRRHMTGVQRSRRGRRQENHRRSAERSAASAI